MQVNSEYVSKALGAVLQYHGEPRTSGYRGGEFSRFNLEEGQLIDVIASALHLAEQLRNEGQPIDPQRVWNRAWDHFDREVLHPDDIELACREERENRNGA